MSFPKKTREGRDVFVRFYYPLPHTYCSLFLYFFPPAGFPVVDLLQQKCDMNKAPQLFAGKIGEISQTGEDRHGKGSPPALSTQFRMEKSQQAPWVLFHRDPNLCPTGFAPAVSRAPLHFYPFKPSPPTLHFHRAWLYGAGDMLASLSPASGRCCHHLQSLETSPPCIVTLWRAFSRNSQQNATRNNNFIIWLRTL